MISVGRSLLLVGAAAASLLLGACDSKSTGNAGPSFVDSGAPDAGAPDAGAIDRPADATTGGDTGEVGGEVGGNGGGDGGDAPISDGGAVSDGADAPADMAGDVPAGDAPAGDRPGADVPAAAGDARDTATPSDGPTTDLPALDVRDALPGLDLGLPDARDGNVG
jgi:hypothetical protein